MLLNPPPDGNSYGTPLIRLRINSAADDAAGLSFAGKMESQLRGINMSIRNAQDGIGLIQTAESD